MMHSLSLYGWMSACMERAINELFIMRTGKLIILVTGQCSHVSFRIHVSFNTHTIKSLNFTNEKLNGIFMINKASSHTLKTRNLVLEARTCCIYTIHRINITPKNLCHIQIMNSKKLKQYFDSSKTI
jgi:hypothetical protein